MNLNAWYNKADDKKATHIQLYERHFICFIFFVHLLKIHVAITNEKYDFSVFVLIHRINMCKITRQFIPHTIDFMRITSV